MYASWGGGGEPDSLCVVVGRGGGLQIRRGEATRYAGFEAPGGPVCTPVCLPRSGCWATGPELGLWGLPFACACKWNAPIDREGEGEAGPQGPSPAAGFKVGMLRCCVCDCGREPLHPSTLPACHPPSHLSLSLSLSRPIPAVWQPSLAVWQP